MLHARRSANPHAMFYGSMSHCLDSDGTYPPRVFVKKRDVDVKANHL